MEDNIMPDKYSSKKVLLSPASEEVMQTVGHQITMARKRRRLSMKLVAERAAISHSTLWKIEKGDPGVAIGAYLRVLNAIGLGNDMLLLAKDDELGRILQDAELERRR